MDPFVLLYVLSVCSLCSVSPFVCSFCHLLLFCCYCHLLCLSPSSICLSFLLFFLSPPSVFFSLYYLASSFSYSCLLTVQFSLLSVLLTSSLLFVSFFCSICLLSLICLSPPSLLVSFVSVSVMILSFCFSFFSSFKVFDSFPITQLPPSAFLLCRHLPASCVVISCSFPSRGHPLPSSLCPF